MEVIRRFRLDNMGGEKDYCRNTWLRIYLLKRTVKFSNLRLGCNVWIRSRTDNCKICNRSRGELV